jgi:hypothetical protein
MKKLFVVIASVVLIAAFAVPASAAEWSLYGNARIATWIVDQDFGEKTFSPLGTRDTSDEELIWTLQTNSRVGANIKGENLKAQFEYGTGVNLRRLYGEYDFGGWKLLIGQDYTPVTEFISGQAFDDLGLIGFGAFYGSRHPQLRFTFGNFEVALVEPSGVEDLDVTGGDPDVTLPKIEAKFKMARDNFSFHVFGGYQTYEIEAPAVGLTTGGTGKDQDVDSTVIGVGGTLNLGPLTLGAQVSQGENIGVTWFSYGAPGTTSFSGPQSSLAFLAGLPGRDVIGGFPSVIAGKIYDVDTLQWFVNGIWKTSDKLSFEVGIGFKEDDYDIPASAIAGLPGVPAGVSLKEDEIFTYYVNAVWEVAPGVFILPEVGLIDYKDGPISGAVPKLEDDGDVQYFGAKWQINF